VRVVPISTQDLVSVPGLEVRECPRGEILGRFLVRIKELVEHPERILLEV
jgi:hypothetical protein